MKKFLTPLLAAGLCLTGCSNDDGRGDGPIRLAMIPKGTTHEFWKAVHAGGQQAVADLAAEGIEIDLHWKGPLREDDREQQIQVVETFVSQQVDGIILAPLDARALVSPVNMATRREIPVVVFDSALQSSDRVSFVATDNFAGGQLAAQALGDALGGRGNVILLRYAAGSASTEDRENGFLEVMDRDFPGITLISTDQHAGATRETALQASQNLLNRYGDMLQGVFTPNESSTVGMLLALRAAGLAGEGVVHIGFDAGEQLLAALRDGDIDALVVQDPFDMGYQAVKIMVDHLNGESVPERVDTGLHLVTTENLDSPEIQQVLDPQGDLVP